MSKICVIIVIISALYLLFAPLRYAKKYRASECMFSRDPIMCTNIKLQNRFK